MATFSLVPEPTFKAKVAIPIPGKKPQNIEFTFKWRDGDALKEFVDALGNFDTDTDAAMEFATGWDLADAFSRENVEKLIKNYPGAAKALVTTYLGENAGARLGN